MYNKCNGFSKVKNLVYFYISTFRSICVQCPIWLFSLVPCFIIIIIIIIIMIIIIMSFMQGMYNYISETNYVSREYSVAAILLLLYMVLISIVPVLNLLYFYISTFRSVLLLLLLLLRP